MEYINIYDVETSGINQLQCRILQLAMITLSYDRETQEFDYLGSENWYCYHENNPHIEDGAYAIHGLTDTFLRENGISWRELAPILYKKMCRTTGVGYNNKTFDNNVLAYNLASEGYGDAKKILDADSLFSFNRSVDCYKLATKLLGRRAKLNVARTALGITDEMVTYMCQVFFGKSEIDLHDARRDVVETYLIWEKGGKPVEGF